MRKLFPLLFFLIATNLFGQYISVDNTVTTAVDVENMINNVLIGEGSTCASIGNVSKFTGIDTAGNPNGIGTFDASGTIFPFDAGVILSSGNINNAPGPNTSVQDAGSRTSWLGDTDLEAQPGIPDNTKNASFIKFDFTPNASEITFNYIFLSEEYNNLYECNYADAFAFILTNLSTGASTNLAVVPTTGEPITVETIRNLPDSPPLCPAENPSFFGNYNFLAGGPNDVTPANSPTNFNGQTTILTAQGVVVPGETYSIKLVVADQRDNRRDIAVMIEAGSFNFGLSLGEDRTIARGNAACSGEVVTLDATPGTSPAATFQWQLFNDLSGTFEDIVGATNGTYDVITTGNYQVVINATSGCSGTDDIIIEFVDSVTATRPTDLYRCDDLSDDGVEEFDLEAQIPTIIGTQNLNELNISFHKTPSDANLNENPIPGDTSAYVNTTPIETIYVRVESIYSAVCIAITEFKIEVGVRPVAVNPGPYRLCDDLVSGSDTDGFSIFDFSTLSDIILDGLDPDLFTVSYHNIPTDAVDGSNPLPLQYRNEIPNVAETIYIRLQNNADPSCIGNIESFTIEVLKLPTLISDSVVLEVCDTDTDGFVTFDLTDAHSLISANYLSDSFTYRDPNGDPINDPENYINQTPGGEVIDVTVSNSDLCSLLAQITLWAGIWEVPAGTLYRFNDCDTDNDGIVMFDFSSTEAAIEALYSNQSVNVSYYETETEAINEVNSINNINTYPNNPAYTDPLTGIQEIWVRVDGDNAGTCVSIGVHVELSIASTLNVIDDITPLAVCSDTLGSGNFDLTEKDTEITLGNPSYTVAYYSSIQNYIAVPPIPITDPTNFNNTTYPQTIYYSLTDASGCSSFDIINFDQDFELILNPIPVINAISDYEVCDTTESGSDSDGISTFYLSSLDTIITGGDVDLVVTYYPNEGEAAIGDAPLNDVYRNEPSQTIGVRVEDRYTTCYSTATLNLVVNELPTPTVIPSVEECDVTENDGDPTNDGDAIFDLTTTVTTRIINGEPFLGLSFHENISDAENGTPFIPNPESFETASRTIYVRATDTDPSTGTACYRVIALELVVNPAPALPVIIPDLTECDVQEIGENPGEEVFDLSKNDDVIFGSHDRNEYDVSYHETLASASSALGSQNDTPILNPIQYIATAPTTPIYVRLVHRIKGCPSVGQFNLIITPVQTIAPLVPLEACDTAGPLVGTDDDGITSFDLTSLDILITNGDPTLSVTYYESQEDLDIGISSAIINPASYVNKIRVNQLIYILVTSSQVGVCPSETSVELKVNPLPVIRDPLPALVTCDQFNDGGTYDLQSYASNLLAALSDISLRFYDSYANAAAYTTVGEIDAMLPFNNSAGLSSLFIAVQDTNTSTTTECRKIYEVDLVALPIPETPSNLTALEVCDPNSDGMEETDLTQKEDAIYGNQDRDLLMLTYHTSEMDAISIFSAIEEPAQYLAVQEELIWARLQVDDGTSNMCYAITSFVISMEGPPVLPASPQPLVECTDITQDESLLQGVATFDLTLNTSLITGNAPSASVTYYTSQEDADSMTHAIDTPTQFINTSNPQTIYYRAISSLNDCVNTIVSSFEVIVNDLPYVQLDETEGTLCVNQNTGDAIAPFDIDGTVENAINGVSYNYVWQRDGVIISQNEFATVNTQGTYDLTVTAIYPNGRQCEYWAQAIYTAKSAPSFEAKVLEGSFNTNGRYTVTVENVIGLGEGPYVFAIGDGPFQDSTTFTNVTAGDHTVYGRLKNGDCSITEFDISIIDYPRYFTPNSDGYHDTWNIIGLGKDPNFNAQIYIFDRYGKLIKQISPAGEGWDGTFNGQPMPSSNYWFKVEYTEPDAFGERRTVQGNFVLKR